jgi:antirestriction protein
MNNNTKKYGMGGAVQSFSSPMLAQGMQGGLSGFGTSGLQTFADGGQMTDIERILAKYKAMESNKPKEDKTSEFLRKSWEGKNLDDYIMYSDKYKRGGKMAHGGVIQHGLQEGDKIVKEVENKYLIVASKGGVYSVVDIEKGSRFIVGLDDSKMSGKRTSAKAGVKQAMEYINYLKSTKMAKGGTFANGGGLDDAKIYVADLAEYNNGRLVGKWLDLSDYSSGAEVMEAIQEMLDEQTKKDKYGDVHEEYAIHDFEGFPSSFYHESMGESDFDALYDIMKVADSSNLPLEVLMEAVSDLGYEDDPERVAEAYYSSVPASMGNEWRDFAYDYIDSIGSIKDAVSNPDYYFDFESFGSDVRMDYTDEELEEMGYNDLSDTEIGEQMADEMGGVKYLGEELIERYFDYDKFGRELEYDFISVRGKDGNYYFFNRNFAKGGEVSSQKIYEVQYEIGGKKHTSQFLMYDSDRVENLLPPETKIISIREKFAKGGEVAKDFAFDTDGDYEDRDLEEKKIDILRKKIDFDSVRGAIDYRKKENNTNLRFFKNGELVMSIQGNYDEDFDGVNARVNAFGYTNFMNYHPSDGFGGLNMPKFEKEVNRVFQEFDEETKSTKFAKGGKIGFEGLAKKVAKRYVGKKVSKEYQAEYGKTYDAKEAKEVGNKVAGKVYQQQVAKKKIVRKLQRKSK